MVHAHIETGSISYNHILISFENMTLLGIGYDFWTKKAPSVAAVSPVPHMVTGSL